MAFLLVQHLDPAHASFMVSLLANHTAMEVAEAGEGTRLEPNKVYVIPPGRYLTVSGGELHLSPVGGGGGARMPFDVLLQSLAEAYGNRAACAVLSGTGSDGSVGAQAIREKGGLTLAQDPSEADFDGMPQSAIAAGAIGQILPLVKVADALAKFARYGAAVPAAGAGGAFVPTAYAKIIDLLRRKTAHDFDLHKRGTLMRRIQRRMGFANLDSPDAYLDLLEKNPGEVSDLVDDLFINVTRFFRDAEAFNLLATEIIPNLIRDHPYNEPIRAWVAGCSTGEEAYSMAIILLEAIAVAGRNIKLTVFASDIDEDAISFARYGLYPSTIEADVSAARLARFFVKEDQGYRVLRSLRDLVVFSVHDLLSDAPFSRMDMVSCCNVLIYLRAEAQQQILGLFHFALRDGGILFLGSSGSVGDATDRFEAISRKARIYRHLGRSRPGEVELPIGRGELTRSLWARPARPPLTRRPGISDLAQRLLLQTYAPASVLANARNEGIYYFGPIDRYLRLPEGEASQAILSAAREGLRSALRSALEKASRDQERAVVSGVRVRRDGEAATVTVSVQPVKIEGEQFLLVSFTDEPESPKAPAQQPALPAASLSPDAAAASPDVAAHIARLERDLDTSQQEIEHAARDREIAEEELRAVNEEAMSLNEEFQTTNEELQTSKEELQSLNEELTTLNVQLQETVNREHGAADDLHNILSSTNVGTLFLDEALNIRFFTPTAKPLFNLISSDVGRPMADLARNFADADLIADARAVLAKSTTVSREIATDDGLAFIRRALPYLTRENQIKGVVVTYVDISEVKSAERAVAQARADAEKIVGELRAPLLILDAGLRVIAASRAFYRLLGANVWDTIGRDLASVGAGELNIPRLAAFLDIIRANAGHVENYQMEVNLRAIGRRKLVFNAVDIPHERDVPRKILVVIDDITERTREQVALVDSQRGSDAANLAKSRFLAAASHDLRQPVQTLCILQAILERKAGDEETKTLASRMGESLATMTDMLDTLLGISQLEAGVIVPEISDISIGVLLNRLRTEFAPRAEACGLGFRLVPCRFSVRSDPRLLEQILRNLLANAVKYTRKGKILVGCRRRGDMLRVEVWDTGIGIPNDQIGHIFEEYHQVNNPARQSELGVGLGLAIVRRLTGLLGHGLDVRSTPERGSVFAVTVPLAEAGSPASPPASHGEIVEAGASACAVLIVEDNEPLRMSFQMFLGADGYRLAGAADGAEALAMVTDRRFVPDVVVADYNLPGALNGVQVVERLRALLGRAVPAVILTGDVSTGTAQEIERSGSLRCTKPIAPKELSRVVASLSAPQVTGQPETTSLQA